MPKFVLVDDHPVILSGLAAVFRAHPEYQVAATATSAAQAHAFVLETRCDMLIADVHLLGQGFETLRTLRALRPDLKIVIFTETACPSICLQVMEAGANAFVLKDSSTDELRSVVEMVLSGQDYISFGMAPSVSLTHEMQEQKQQRLTSKALSSRETQVVQALLDGASNREIAANLNISYTTVKFYMNQIMHKLDVRNRVEVALEFQRLKN